MPNRLIISLLCLFTIVSSSYAEELKMQEYVAHGGGAIKGMTSTNSLEALDDNYKKGFRFFEIDFEWTSDKELVLIHDWKETLNRLFHAEPNVYPLGGFKKLKMATGLTQMSIMDLAGWMDKHKDVYIITDIKSNNIEGLDNISRYYRALRNRVIPQIYTYEEYEKVKDMGFRNIILTLYIMNYKDNEVIDFLNNHKVSALTMWYYRANRDFVDKLKKIGIFIYVHTVNDPELKDQLKKLGVDGFYTDFLTPSYKE